MARWTDLAPWRGPSINSGDGDGTPLEAADAVTEVRGLVVHIAEGFFEGTISWEKNPDADVSSHFVSGRAGGRAQMVDTHDRAWTQSDGNPYWLSIENEGFTLNHPLWRPDWERLTPQQIEFNAQLLARIHREYGVPLKLATSPWDKGLAYHSLGAENGLRWGHPDCPGEPIKAQLPEILARAIEITGGEDMLTQEARDEILWNLGWFVQRGIIEQQDPIEIPANPEAGIAAKTWPNMLARAIKGAGGWEPSPQDLADLAETVSAAANKGAADAVAGLKFGVKLEGTATPAEAS